MSIREYVRKRKFAATPEPKPLRFYVQEHHATRLHYDLRLEIDGVLKSWALPKPPSFDPAITRLAVEVEDHPLEYGSFEGTIPKGNYGAGEVTVWDRGTYVCRNGDPSRAKDEGHLTLIFSGKRLRGEFALVRTEKASKQVHWLFIKKRDGYAHFGSTDTGDLSAPGTKLFRPVKRRGPPVDLTSTAGWILEPWDEGTRVIASWDGGEVHYYSRDLLPLKPKVDARALARVKARFRGLPPCVCEGIFPWVVRDVLAWDGQSLEEKPLHERQALVRERFNPKLKTLNSPVLLSRVPWDPVLIRPRDSRYTPGMDPSASLVSRASLSKPLRAAGSRPLPLSHPTKRLWPKHTKADLAGYFESVASTMLPFLEGRPLSLHRFPHGIGGKGFFQKNLIGSHPAFVQTFPHILCQNPETLRYFANLSVLEIHPWLSHLPTLDHPDLIVLDLDPDGNSFGQVCEVALAARELLVAAGRNPRVKTSGADGLHIGVRALPEDTFESGRSWMLDIARRLHLRFPTLTSLERKPALRKKKIYLDCFQNSRGQTIVAPLSPRPREGAPVSIPLRWEELGSKIRPTDFSISSVPARILMKQYSCRELWDVGLRTSV